MKTIMYTYNAYGLKICSQIALQEFTPAFGDGDVTVTYSDNDSWAEGVRERDYHVEIASTEARFWFKDAGSFAVRNGVAIDVVPAPGADPELLRLYIQGMMMAMLLYQRGLCVLHSSVVQIGDAAIALMGHVGAGKSSLAAALSEDGCFLVSDDNAAVDLAGTEPTVVPAYPFVKLFPAIASTLGYDGKKLRNLHSGQKKVAGAAGDRFASEKLPLKLIYVLGRQHPPEIQPFRPAQAMVELIRNTVPTRWGCSGDANHLMRCGVLANQVPIFSVRTFETLPSLPRVAQQIKTHSLQHLRYESASLLSAHGSPEENASRSVGASLS